MTTIANTAEHAADHVKEATSHARGSLLDLAAQVMRLVNGAREAEGRGVEAVLDRLGLQRQSSSLGPVLWFAAGAAVAGSAALLLAPTSGQKLRQRLAVFFDGEIETLGAHAKAMEERVEEAVKTHVGTPSTKTPANGANREIG